MKLLQLFQSGSPADTRERMRTSSTFGARTTNSVSGTARVTTDTLRTCGVGERQEAW